MMETNLKRIVHLIKNKISTPDFWSGNYSSWSDVKSKCSGYDSQEILQKSIIATRKVLNGEAAFERDTVLFQEMEWNQPLISSLLYVAKKENSLSVFDVGGALGSLYHQYSKFLNSLTTLNWNICEQDLYVDAGNKEFATEQLSFHKDLSPLKNGKINLVLISSSLQYFEKPYEFLSSVLEYKPKYILIDRTPFNLENGDRLTLQKVPDVIYKASYPCWFFDKMKFLNMFSQNYKLVWEFEAIDKANIPSQFKGFLFELRK